LEKNSQLLSEIVALRFRCFWERQENDWAMQQKFDMFYGPDLGDYEEYEDDTESCDFTGEDCFGNKLFCEECPILTDNWEDEK
jgi:hypothetical protein